MVSINPVVTVNDKEVDLSPALPLLLEDWFALEDKGVTMETMQKASLKVMYELACHVIHKASPSTDLAGVRKMTMSQLRDVFSVVAEAEMASVPNRPSTTSSTNSP